MPPGTRGAVTNLLSLEYSAEYDLAASSGYGFDPSHATYIRLGAQEYAGANYQFHVASGVVTSNPKRG